jgi:S1-C subfamily serine protease
MKNFLHFFLFLCTTMALVGCAGSPYALKQMSETELRTVSDVDLCDAYNFDKAWSGNRVPSFNREIRRRTLDCVYVERRGENSTFSKPDTSQKQSPSSGSGVVFNKEGDVLSNEHVVNGCGKLSVVIGGISHPASIVAKDSTNDIAVLRTSLKNNRYSSLRHSATIELGEQVMVLGYPLRGLLSEQMHATSGDVTALAGISGDSRFFQTSAPIQPGNSGGPVVDKSGSVVGLATAKLNALSVAKVTGDIPQNVNFGLKSAVVLNFLDSVSASYTIISKGEKLEKTEIVKKVGPSVVAVLCD